MTKLTHQAWVIGVNGNLVSGRANSPVAMNEVCQISLTPDINLKAEIIRVRDNEFDAQVFEDTRDIKTGDKIILSGELLSIELGPGLLGGVFDGLGNPLNQLAQKDGFFLKRGRYLDTINKQNKFKFEPIAQPEDILIPGQALGYVLEGIYKHLIMIPFKLLGKFKLISLSKTQEVTPDTTIAEIKNIETQEKHNITLTQKWPVKIPLALYEERLLPHKLLSTKVRIVDTFFPIAEGGTACIPGPFGSGKTVFQQCVSRYGDADIVIVAACGERAGEVVETLREFPELTDPKTGRSLMERTIIICNTSSMPVAAREASVYTAITMAEYYRQMGLKILVLADSTSRWAQAIREMSGRLEEIPGEEAFPAYLGSLIAGFYERAGIIKLKDKNLGTKTGSLTLIGTVSPAGGNFEEPVTQATLSVVGCFLGLTYARSYAKRFPAIAPLDSWSKYLESMTEELDKRFFPGFVNKIKTLKIYYQQGQKIGDQMKVVGEEDVHITEFEHFHKSEFFDAVFLQQNAFDPIDAAPSEERVSKLLLLAAQIIDFDFKFANKIAVRTILGKLIALFRDLNSAPDNSTEFQNIEKEIISLLVISPTQESGAHP